jgi:GT2 family glycosyltransferase
VAEQVSVITYVDSGSSDNSVKHAVDIGVAVVELDMAIPFTAARARNSGAKGLLENNPDLEYIQFVDGDCELVTGWVVRAVNYLDGHNDYAVACGRRREFFPEQSIYNALCDIEWDTPIGDAGACGGDALIRIESFNQVEGYREDRIAGEEPEMCFRLRQRGLKIARLNQEMTLHDAAMTHFNQWWQRTRRSGFAFMAGADLHGRSSERFWVAEVRSILFWAVLLPVLCLLFAIVNPYFFMGFTAYPLQIFRLGLKGPRAGVLNFQWAFFIVLGKFPQLLGVVQYWRDRLAGKSSKIIEYK